MRQGYFGSAVRGVLAGCHGTGGEGIRPVWRNHLDSPTEWAVPVNLLASHLVVHRFIIQDRCDIDNLFLRKILLDIWTRPLYCEDMEAIRTAFIIFDSSTGNPIGVADTRTSADRVVSFLHRTERRPFHVQSV